MRPFISEELHVKLSNLISYTSKGGVESEGISAEILADICDIYIKANEKGALSDNQYIAENAYKILHQNFAYATLYPPPSLDGNPKLVEKKPE